jgi:hypothetical protein
MFTRPFQTLGGMLMFFSGYAGASIDNVWLSVAAVLLISLPGWAALDRSMEQER